MYSRSWSGLLLSFGVFLMVPMSAATNLDPAHEPWPALLANEPFAADADFTALQQRANLSLERLQLVGASPY